MILSITGDFLIVHKHQGKKTSTIFTQSSRKSNLDVEALEERIKNLIAQDEDYVLTFQKFNETINQPFILVIITRLMKESTKW